MAAPEGVTSKRSRTASKAGAEPEVPAAEASPSDAIMSPLDYLLSILRDEEQPQSARVEAAKAAAPYLHPRLAQVAHGGAIQLSHEQALDELE